MTSILSVPVQCDLYLSLQWRNKPTCRCSHHLSMAVHKLCSFSEGEMLFCMAQNFDGGNFWRIRVRKNLTSKKLTNVMYSFYCHLKWTCHAYCVRTLFYNYLRLATWRENLNTSTHMYSNWYKHKPATPFLRATRYVLVWRRARDITSQYVHWSHWLWFTHVTVCYNIHSLY